MATQQYHALDYPQLIFSAIKTQNEKHGANKTTISNHIQTTIAVDLPTTHSTLLTYHLNKLTASGELIIVKNNYFKPDPDAPLRRGRGRPPKVKESCTSEMVVSPVRPRGRPPKVRDGDALVTSTPVVSGRKRGRPPKVGGSTIKTVDPASGERRGRGRPPKGKITVAAPVGA